ncbi:hypothetical protein JTB14_033804 [Gonioctena quinquepunctata]|nr:hypothetical protein JTB14_033804 [Gonioctena quinquepunctata]
MARQDLELNDKPKYLGIRLSKTLPRGQRETSYPSALALCFSTVEYAAPVWINSAYTKHIDVALKETRIGSGYLKPTPTEEIYPIVVSPHRQSADACYTGINCNRVKDGAVYAQTWENLAQPTTSYPQMTKPPIFGSTKFNMATRTRKVLGGYWKRRQVSDGRTCGAGCVLHSHGADYYRIINKVELNNPPIQGVTRPAPIDAWRWESGVYLVAYSRKQRHREQQAGSRDTNHGAGAAARKLRNRTWPKVNMPPPGEPGGLNDPLRRGLSDAGVIWYPRLLDQDMTPEEARKKTSKRSSDFESRKLLTLVEVQNVGLNTQLWRILSCKKEGNGQWLTLGIDDDSCEAIKKIGHTIFFRFGKIIIMACGKIREVKDGTTEHRRQASHQLQLP